jgi:hypothetical protein
VPNPEEDLDPAATTVRTTFEAIAGGLDPTAAFRDDTAAFSSDAPISAGDVASLGIRVRTVEVKSGLHR